MSMIAYKVEVRISRDDDLFHPNYRGGSLVETWKNSSGLLHRENGPALMIKNPETGSLVSYTWYKYGKVHREAGQPAHMRIEDHGFTRFFEWYERGELHRFGSPAVLMERIADHDGPFEVPVRVSDEWRERGYRHREGGPAYVYMDDETGVILSEIWCCHGQVHRDDGPAVVHRNAATGEITYTEFHLRGVRTSAISLPRAAP